MFGFQTHLIFPVHAVPDAGPLPRNAEAMCLTTPDGERLKGAHFSPHSGSDRTLILGFGGNAWNAQDAGEYLHELYPDKHVITFHYRGYRPSTGSPSAEALIADAPLVYDAAVQQARPTRVVAVGLSIGTGVAAQLSAERKLDGLILVTPFDSLKAVAQSMYPWLPVAPFFSQDIDAIGPLKRSGAPFAIVAAGRDEIVAAARTEALRHGIASLRFDRTIEDAGHNDIYARSEFQEAMREAFTAVTR